MKVLKILFIAQLITITFDLPPVSSGENNNIFNNYFGESIEKIGNKENSHIFVYKIKRQMDNESHYQKHDRISFPVSNFDSQVSVYDIKIKESIIEYDELKWPFDNFTTNFNSKVEGENLILEANTIELDKFEFKQSFNLNLNSDLDYITFNLSELEVDYEANAAAFTLIGLEFLISGKLFSYYTFYNLSVVGPNQL